MLTASNGAIYETASMATTGAMTKAGAVQMTQAMNCVDYGQYTVPYYQWGGYQVYVCHDKTKKAIEVLKCLQREKLVKKIEDVDGFIAMVEKIAAIL